jgi:DNA-binding response OmpR family regulator
VKLLLVEDDEDLSSFLTRVLREEGLDVSVSDCARRALDVLERETFQLVILDRMLPDLDGLAVCAEIRKRELEVGVLMLTARGELEDRVGGLEAGADDYLVKPFEVEELIARVRALLRRAGSNEATVGALRVDGRRRAAWLDSKPLELTVREVALLSYLVQNVDRAVSREELLKAVWEATFDPGTNVVEVYVSRLRTKLGGFAWMLETVRGGGYRIRRDPN